MASEQIYKVIFINQGHVYEVFARQIYQSDLYGFIEVEEFIFGEKAKVVVDPSEEKLKAEFENVNRSYIPIAAIIRIDEVEKEGAAKIVDIKDSNVAPFPLTISPNKD